jgi:hypothetical protein
VLHPFEPSFHQRGPLSDAALGQIGQRPLEMRPDQLDRVQLVRVRRQAEDHKPVAGAISSHRGADVGVQVAPDDHERHAEVMVRVVRRGENPLRVSPHRRPRCTR